MFVKLSRCHSTAGKLHGSVVLQVDGARLSDGDAVLGLFGRLYVLVLVTSFEWAVSVQVALQASSSRLPVQACTVPWQYNWLTTWILGKMSNFAAFRHLSVISKLIGPPKVPAPAAAPAFAVAASADILLSRGRQQWLLLRQLRLIGPSIHGSLVV